MRRLETALVASLLLALLSLRIPAWVAPVGSDQYLYLYIADRILDGGVPYVDAWDQKPPGVYFVYGLLRSVWPYTSIVALADLLAAAILAWALVRLGRETLGVRTGYTAAAVALLLGHPSLSRLDGVYIRGQCETFIAPAITLSLVCLVRHYRSRLHLAAAGIALGGAFWLKYNTLAYMLPIAAATALWAERRETPRSWLIDLGWISGGFLAVTAPLLGWFLWRGAMAELWVSTLRYNLDYSGETYDGGLGAAVRYLATMPVTQARTDLLWFVGCLGGIFLTAAGMRQNRRLVILSLSWLAAAVLSIAINGARDLPQYFVQAVPALSFVAAAGGMLAWRSGTGWRLLSVAGVLVGLWRVGVEPSAALGLRLGDLPGLAQNVRFDTARLVGRADTRDYLSRFKGAQKYDALANADLVDFIRRTTNARDSIFIFGFAPGVYVEADRVSASRFFWSRPIIIEFEAARPGYGSSGLLAELRRNTPAIVALQKQDWDGIRDSHGYFHDTPPLNEWLVSGYSLVMDTPVFEVWRLNPRPDQGGRPGGS